MRELEPMLLAIAAVACGHDDAELRGKIESDLGRMKEAGFNLTDAVHGIWDGERDEDTLTGGLGEQDSEVVRRILVFIEDPSQADLLSGLPPAILEALSLEGEAAMSALRDALSDMPEEEGRAILKRLSEAGIIGTRDGDDPDTEDMQEQLEPMFQAIAAIARGHDNPAIRERIDSDLAQLDKQGWHLTDAVQRIWNGERDEDTLTAGLDEEDSGFVGRILELVNQPSPGEVISALPSSVQEALSLDGDDALGALRDALSDMAEDDATAILEKLTDAGIIGVHDGDGPDTEKILRESAPLFRDIAAVAQGQADSSVRDNIASVLPKFEEQGWKLTDAVHRIWEGERDMDTLTAGIDSNSAQLVQAILEMLDEG